MSKLLLLSLLIATLAIPIVASKDPNPQRGHAKTVRWYLAFVVAYFFGLLFVYPHLI